MKFVALASTALDDCGSGVGGFEGMGVLPRDSQRSPVMNCAINQLFHAAVKYGSNPFALKHHPILIKVWQEFALIVGKIGYQPLEIKFSPLDLHHIQPIIGLTVKGEREFSDEEIFCWRGFLGGNSFANTPQFVAQILACILLREIGPQNAN